jgi:hypothetical protein
MGFTLEDQQPLIQGRHRWAKEWHEIAQQVPKARDWRRGAIALAEELLTCLKNALIDPHLPRPAMGEIGNVERLLAHLRRTDGAALVAEYNAWAVSNPVLTDALVWAARMRAQAERRALTAYLEISQRGINT